MKNFLMLFLCVVGMCTPVFASTITVACINDETWNGPSMQCDPWKDYGTDELILRDGETVTCVDAKNNWITCYECVSRFDATTGVSTDYFETTCDMSACHPSAEKPVLNESGQGYHCVPSCSTGYYYTAESGEPACVKCPESENGEMVLGGVGKDKCHVPAGQVGTNAIGSYVYRYDCYYTE